MAQETHILTGIPGYLGSFAFADLPAASAYTGYYVFVTDGAVTTGTGGMAFSDGTNWRRFDTGATMAAA
ncbi:MAG: hypothetical protein AAFV33_09795 [Chloroflexota bacterium]